MQIFQGQYEWNRFIRDCRPVQPQSVEHWQSADVLKPCIGDFCPAQLQLQEMGQRDDKTHPSIINCRIRHVHVLKIGETGKRGKPRPSDARLI